MASASSRAWAGEVPHRCPAAAPAGPVRGLGDPFAGAGAAGPAGQFLGAAGIDGVTPLRVEHQVQQQPGVPGTGEDQLGPLPAGGLAEEIPHGLRDLLAGEGEAAGVAAVDGRVERGQTGRGVGGPGEAYGRQ
jgi:hypothetical protein